MEAEEYAIMACGYFGGAYIVAQKKGCAPDRKLLESEMKELFERALKETPPSTQG